MTFSQSWAFTRGMQFTMVVKMKVHAKATNSLLVAAAAFLLANCSTSSAVKPVDAPQAYRPAPASAYMVTAVPGDTLAKISLRYRVTQEDILAMNTLSPTHKITPGDRLYVPAYGVPAPQPTPPIVAASRAVNVTSPRPAYAAPVRSRVKLYPADVAIIPFPRINPRAAVPAKVVLKNKAVPQKEGLLQRTTWSNPSPVAKSPFRWPVTGTLISNFGQAPGGTRNDGINIAVKRGTAFTAAADGVVTYVGDLKTYGNLLLIKHDNGFVTAYAHADRIAVARGERVRAGEVIGFVGATGEVTQSQLHFEIRQGVKPVNPNLHLPG